jgi:hypothetical protein
VRGALWLAGNIWASDGRVALMPLRFCSAASCRDVSPAHTPCMSIAGYWSAVVRHCSLTGHCLQMLRACLM